VILLIWPAPALLSPSSTTDPTDPDAMAFRVALSRPEVFTPIMNNCPACCSVVRESAFARHLTAAGVGVGEGGVSGVDVLGVPAAVAGSVGGAAGPAAQPVSTEAQAAAAANLRREPKSPPAGFEVRVRFVAPPGNTPAEPGASGSGSRYEDFKSCMFLPERDGRGVGEGL